VSKVQKQLLCQHLAKFNNEYESSKEDYVVEARGKKCDGGYNNYSSFDICHRMTYQSKLNFHIGSTATFKSSFDILIMLL